MISSQVSSGSFEFITSRLNTNRTVLVLTPQLLPVLSAGSCGTAGAGFSLQTTENQNDTSCVAVSHLHVENPAAPGLPISHHPHYPAGDSILPLWWLGAMGKGPEAGGDMETRKLYCIKYPQDRGMHKAGLWRTNLS